MVGGVGAAHWGRIEAPVRFPGLCIGVEYEPKAQTRLLRNFMPLQASHFQLTGHAREQPLYASIDSSFRPNPRRHQPTIKTLPPALQQTHVQALPRKLFLNSRVV